MLRWKRAGENFLKVSSKKVSAENGGKKQYEKNVFARACSLYTEGSDPFCQSTQAVKML